MWLPGSETFFMGAISLPILYINKKNNFFFSNFIYNKWFQSNKTANHQCNKFQSNKIFLLHVEFNADATSKILKIQ